MLKKGLLLLVATLLTSCGVQWKYMTLNHVAQIQQFRTVPDFGVEVDTLTFSQLRWKLRTDFNFRYNIAQYALRQPPSFDWNNRLLGNRYSYRNPYLMYNQYWNRTEMWNDWVWGYTSWNSWGSPHRWSPFGYDRWGYNVHYGWNNHGWGYNGYYGNGWNNYYGWNTGHNPFYGNNYNRRTSTSYINGRRGRVAQTVINKRRTINTNNNDQTTRSNTRTRRIETQSRSNGGRSRSRQIIPNQTIRINRSSIIQPRQIRRRPQPPVLQQSSSSKRTSKQRR